LKSSLPQSVAELKTYIKRLDTLILEKALAWARKTYKDILEQVDELVSKERRKELTIEHKRLVWYQSCLGPVMVKRRQYQDREGKYRYLLDELMGMDKHEHITVAVQELVLEMAAAMPYRRSAEVLRKTSAINLAHQTIWRLVGKLADPYLKKSEDELKWFLKTGEIPKGESKKADLLLIEADGVMLSLQREKERKAEVKLGIAYEGWEKVGKDRYKTVNKTTFAAVTDKDSFWAGMSLKLHRTYDLSRVRETIVGGDGAAWVKEGASYVNGRFQLDRYHLNRELCAALGHDKEPRDKIWQACESGKVELGMQMMVEVMSKAKGEQAQRIAKAYHYLESNRSGLGDYRQALGEEGKGLRRTGAIEGNVDKLVARRMKNQGMSWTLRGIRRLLCVRFLIFEGRLKEWLAREKDSGPSISIPHRKIRRVVNHFSMQEADAWLKAGMPAVYGPHASRLWVQALKSMSQAVSL
jgi:hypothetical protein